MLISLGSNDLSSRLVDRSTVRTALQTGTETGTGLPSCYLFSYLLFCKASLTDGITHKILKYMELARGIEPPTCGLQNRCSAIELRQPECIGLQAHIDRERKPNNCV